MPPFRFDTYHDPYVGTIADLMQKPADVQAAAALARGQAYSQAAQNIGNTVAGTIQRATDPRAKIEAAQLQDIQERQRGAKVMDSLMAGGQPLPPGSVGPQQESYLDPSGLFDVPKLTQALSQAGVGHLAPDLVKGAEAINDSILKHQQLQQQADQQHAVMLGDMADGTIKLLRSGVPIDQALDLVSQPALATKRIAPDEYNQVKSRLLSMPPEQQQAALSSLMDAAAKFAPTKTLGKDAIEVDRYNRIRATNKVPEKVTPEQATIDAYIASLKKPTGTTWESLTPEERAAFPQYQQSLKPKEPHSLDEQLLEALTKGDAPRAKQITDTMTAAAKAKGDPTILAATERQIQAINAQVAQQGRAQSFTEAERGRAVLDAADKDLSTAKASANELRNTVAAAKAGNKFAASQQALQATMASIRSQGLNRINTAEIGASAAAGSLWDRIAGRLGKLAEGQPIPEDVQNDMLEYADILEKASFKKYSDIFDTTTQRYPLPNEKKRAAPSSQPVNALPPGVAARLKGG